MTLRVDLSDLSNLTVTIPEHVLFQHLDGEAVILDVQTGGYFGLNGVGTFVWQHLSDGQTTAQIVGALCEHYEVSEARAASDVRAFLSALQQQGLVILHEQAK